MPLPHAPLPVSRRDARRLVVACQHLDTPRPKADQAQLLAVLRALRFVQLDPISAVAPSHELVLWSRLRPGALPLLDDLLFRQRRLFEYSLAAAAIVLMEDYPLYRAFMDAFPSYPQITAWMEANHALRQHILDRLADGAALPTSAFEDMAAVAWKSSGWTRGRNVECMLRYLWTGGHLMVSGRSGRERLWSLTARYLPEGAVRTALPMDEAIVRAVEHALRALGVAREREISRYFFGLYPSSAPPLGPALVRLRREKRLLEVAIEGEQDGDVSYVHVDSLPRLEAIQAGDWQGRTVLLSPFDNLVIDRDRLLRLWDFSFKNEMYVPQAKRQYGYYVMPILHGDALIGRIAPRLDRRRRVLCVEGLYLEGAVRPTAELCQAVTDEVSDLASLVGATGIEYCSTVPDAWRDRLARL